MAADSLIILPCVHSRALSNAPILILGDFRSHSRKVTRDPLLCLNWHTDTAMDGQNGRRPRAAERERTVAIDSEQALGVIAGRHGIGLDQVVPLPGGAANRVYLLGAELVLRIPRGPEFAADLIK